MNLYNYFYYLNCRSIKIMEKDTFYFNAMMVVTFILSLWVYNILCFIDIIFISGKYELKQENVIAYALVVFLPIFAINFIYFFRNKRYKKIFMHFELLPNEKKKKDWIKARLFMLFTIIFFFIVASIRF